jgi:hypothetical protein
MNNINSGVLCAILFSILLSFIPPKYEYTSVRFLSSQKPDRTGDEAKKVTTIEVDELKLKELGERGWEVCGVFLEPETAYPNFGNETYVTGLQPNVRSQSAVILLKKTKTGLNAIFTK